MTNDHTVSGRFSDDRITATATYRDGALVELTIKALDDRIDVRDYRKVKFAELESAAMNGRHQTSDQTTDPATIRELLTIPAYENTEEWRAAFAAKYILASKTFRNPASRLAEANEHMSLRAIHARVREGRLRGDIPWSKK